MKKIVGLLTAAAVLATSVFAADVAAKVRVGGNIFKYTTGGDIEKGKLKGAPVNKDGDEAGAFSIFNADTISHTYDAPFATLSTSTDEAGATVKFVGDENGVKVGDVQVWFKPIDVLKIQAGSHDIAMNKETIDWTEHHSKQAYGTYGYSLGFAQDAISANVCFGTGDNGWFFQDTMAANKTDAEPFTSAINDLYVNFAYGADFGTISAFFRYQGKKAKIEKTAATEASYGWTWDESDKKHVNAPTWGLIPAKAASQKVTITPDTVSFGAGYKNTIDALTFFVNVEGVSYSALSDKEWDICEKYDENGKAIVYADKNGKSRSAFGFGLDAFVQYAQDALTVKGFVKYDTADFGHLTLKDGEVKEDIMADNNTILELLARVDYKLDNGIGLFAYFKNANLLRKEIQGTDKDPSSVFASTIKLGAAGSVGIASWETALQLDTGKIGGKDGKYNKVNVSMPVWIQVAF